MITLGVFWVSCHYGVDGGALYWGSVLIDVVIVSAIDSIVKL